MSKTAKKVTEYSKAKEALAKQRENLETAQAAASAQGASVQTKSTAKHAETQYETARANVQRLGFKQIAGARATKAIVSIRALSKLANRKAYNFGEADIEKIIGLLNAETKALRDKFNAALTGTSAAKTVETVSFD